MNELDRAGVDTSFWLVNIGWRRDMPQLVVRVHNALLSVTAWASQEQYSHSHDDANCPFKDTYGSKQGVLERSLTQ